MNDNHMTALKTHTNSGHAAGNKSGGSRLAGTVSDKGVSDNLRFYLMNRVQKG